MIAISTALNDYRLNGVIAFLALGDQSATANIFDGVRPAFGATPSGNLLVAIPFAEPLGTVANGALPLTPTPEALILVSGMASWARIANGDGTLGWECDVSDLNGSGELRLPSTTLYAGGYTRIVSGVLG